MGSYNPDARKQYKLRARADIRAHFWPTILAVILYAIPIGLVAAIYELALNGASDNGNVGTIGLIFTVYFLALMLISAPLYLGIKRYMLELAHGEAPGATTVLSCFMNGSDFVKSIKLMLCIFVRSLGWMLLLGLISGIIGGLTAVIGLSGMGDAIKVLLIVLLFAVIVVVACLLSVMISRYNGAYIIVLTNPEQGAWDATGACVPIFRGHLWELLVFDLSFILWVLATICTLGIVGFYMTAYTETAFIHYFEALWSDSTSMMRHARPSEYGDVVFSGGSDVTTDDTSDNDDSDDDDGDFDDFDDDSSDD